jgi:hypothetical protein
VFFCLSHGVSESMTCIKEVIANEVRVLFDADHDVPVMINCPCPKCNNVDLDGPVIALEDV